MDRDSRNTDEGLQGNEKIEQAVHALQQEPSEEGLAHALTVVRRRMREGGQFILAVEPPKGDGKIEIQAVQTADGQQWWSAFTSFEEELKGSGNVMSTFLSDMEKLFTTALRTEGISGVIINPWNRTLMLDKNLIQIVLGNRLPDCILHWTTAVEGTSICVDIKRRDRRWIKQHTGQKRSRRPTCQSFIRWKTSMNG